MRRACWDLRAEHLLHNVTVETTVDSTAVESDQSFKSAEKSDVMIVITAAALVAAGVGTLQVKVPTHDAL